MPVKKLAAAFDRPDGDSDLLAHVPGCGACTTSLAVLAAAGTGLKHLTAEAAGTAVERVLVRGKEAGRRKLADLVYELAKACLVVVQDIDRRLHLEKRPRDQAVINGEMRGVAARLPRGERRAVDSLPRTKPSEERALAAAESCIKILEDVEGASERQRLSRAVWLISAGHPGRAQQELESLLSAVTSKSTMRFVYWNLLWSLNAQKKYADTLGHGDTALRKYRGDRTITYNLCVASACLGRRDLFTRFARMLRQSESVVDTEIEDRLLQFEAPQFAEKLSIDVAAVEKAFGLEARNGAA